MNDLNKKESIINSLLTYLPETAQLLSSLVDMLNETNSSEETNLQELKKLVIRQRELLKNIKELGEIVSDITITETDISIELFTNYKFLLFKLLLGSQFLNDWLSIQLSRINKPDEEHASIEESDIILSKSIDNFYESGEYVLKVVDLLDL